MLLASRELMREAAAHAGQPADLEEFLGASAPCSDIDLADPQTVFDVVADTEVGEQAVALEHHAHVPAVRRQFQYGFAADEHVSSVDRFETGEDAQSRRLAVARRAEEADHAAGLDVDVEVLEHLGAAIGLVHVLEAHGLGLVRLLGARGRWSSAVQRWS